MLHILMKRFISSFKLEKPITIILFENRRDEREIFINNILSVFVFNLLSICSTLNSRIFRSQCNKSSIRYFYLLFPDLIVKMFNLFGLTINICNVYDDAKLFHKIKSRQLIKVASEFYIDTVWKNKRMFFVTTQP